MFHSLTGDLTAKKPDRIYLAVGGIEWEIPVTASSLNRFPPVGQRVRVFTYLHHREDGMTLFGFAGEQERSVFLDLITVNGVGPKAALKILSGIPVRDFIEALDGEDVTRLSRIPGLGRKTAQKIILALRDKLTLEPGEEEGDPGDAPAGDREGGAVSRREIVASLKEMGFDRRKAEAAVDKISGLAPVLELPAADREAEILRRSIIELSR